MTKISKPHSVKLVCPVLASSEKWFKSAEAVLQDAFGPIDLTSKTWEFCFTDYYEKEMGTGLQRRIYSFRDLTDAGELAGIKLHTCEQERRIGGKCREAGGRVVNLDPGYVCDSKLVLATTKDYWHRIYLGSGIFAETTLVWRKSGFEPLETTYPDYRTAAYREFFELVRTLYHG